MKFYEVTDKIRETLINDAQVNTVSFGDIFEMDLKKKSIYSIANVNPDGVIALEYANRYTFSIILADITDISKDSDINPFLGNNNLHDVLNTQLMVANIFIDKFRRGDLYRDGYQIVGDPNIDFFYERFDNVLAGVAFQLQIDVKKDISIC